MPGKVKVRVLAGRNLPVMDRSSDTTDAYVEVKLANITFKTEVYRKSLNPQWNSEWFIFEVDDLDLQDEPLQIRLMDHDTYSANDAIGKVYIDLNPLLFVPTHSHNKLSNDPSNNAGTLSGWLPVYDTMHGIRGEVNVLVKVDLFSDFNKFRQSSCGIQFFFTPEIPFGFKCNSIIGFVEELVVNDDPEYQWIDKIRTPRASNEARQTLFSKLSGELQRRIGLKVLDQGGNAVLGYRQCFDLEGESGIVVRGIGSIVNLVRLATESVNPTEGGIFSLGREYSLSEGHNQKDYIDSEYVVHENFANTLTASFNPFRHRSHSLIKYNSRQATSFAKSYSYACHSSFSKNSPDIGDKAGRVRVFTKPLMVNNNDNDIQLSRSIDRAVLDFSSCKLSKRAETTACEIGALASTSGTHHASNYTYRFDSDSCNKTMDCSDAEHSFESNDDTLKTNLSLLTELGSSDILDDSDIHHPSDIQNNKSKSSKTSDSATRRRHSLSDPSLSRSFSFKRAVRNYVKHKGFSLKLKPKNKNHSLKSTPQLSSPIDGLEKEDQHFSLKFFVGDSSEVSIPQSIDEDSCELSVKKLSEFIKLYKERQGNLREQEEVYLPPSEECDSVGTKSKDELNKGEQIALGPDIRVVPSTPISSKSFTSDLSANNVVPRTEALNSNSTRPLNSAFEFENNNVKVQSDELRSPDPENELTVNRNYSTQLNTSSSNSMLSTNIAFSSTSSSSYSCKQKRPNNFSYSPTVSSSSSHISLHAVHSHSSVECGDSIRPIGTSPKRGSRSRKTSGPCSASRSPQQLPELIQESTETAHSFTGGVLASPTHIAGVLADRRSSDSDLSITPKGFHLSCSGNSSGKPCGTQGNFRGGSNPLNFRNSFDSIIHPFLTMKSFPPDFIVHLGGTVSARSVKILDRGSHIPEELDSRDSWWSQIRTEIRSHAKSLSCNVVLGYEEFTTICDDICILNATGTAAVINICSQDTENCVGLVNKTAKDPPPSTTVSLERKEHHQNGLCRSHPSVTEDSVDASKSAPKFANQNPSKIVSPCIMCHIPYIEKTNPFNMKIMKCSVCKVGKVPDVLLSTLDLPSTLPVIGRGCLIQARVIRAKRDLKGELHAKEISDSLPFLEYELHKQLYHKIMINGMNAVFGLRIRVTVGEKIVVGVGTGTAVFLAPLPPAPFPCVSLVGASFEEEKVRIEMQKRLSEAFERNKEEWDLKDVPNENTTNGLENNCSDSEDSDDEPQLMDVDLSCGNKGTFVLDLDDMEDVEMLNLLLEGSQPSNITTVSTQLPPNFSLDRVQRNLQMFTKVWISKIPSNLSRAAFNSYFEELLQSIYFKVRNLTPCIVSGLKVDVALPEPDELQISVIGMVLGELARPPCFKPASNYSKNLQSIDNDEKKSKSDDSELMFHLEGLKEITEEKHDFDSQITPASIVLSTSATRGSECAATTAAFNTSSKADLRLRDSCSSSARLPSVSSVSSVPSVPSNASFSSNASSGKSSVKIKMDRSRLVNRELSWKDHFGVEITPLSFIPGAKIQHHLGNLNFFFIRESNSMKEIGGLSGFLGSFVTEVLALVRAHVSSLGGNAMISYFLSECILLHNPHKNQAQCLINVGGDIVNVTYPRSAVLQEDSSGGI